MRIVCQKCSAAYAIDDKLVTPKGIRAQCPRCRHLQLVKNDLQPAVTEPAMPATFAMPASAAAAAPAPDSDLFFDFSSPAAPAAAPRVEAAPMQPPPPSLASVPDAGDMLDFSDLGDAPPPEPATSPRGLLPLPGAMKKPPPASAPKPLPPPPAPAPVSSAPMSSASLSSAPQSSAPFDFSGEFSFEPPPAPLHKQGTAPGLRLKPKADAPLPAAPPPSAPAPGPGATSSTVKCKQCGKVLTDPFDQALGVCDDCRNSQSGAHSGAGLLTEADSTGRPTASAAVPIARMSPAKSSLPDAGDDAATADFFEAPPPTQVEQPRLKPLSRSVVSAYREGEEPQGGSGKIVAIAIAAVIVLGGGGLFLLIKKPWVKKPPPLAQKLPISSARPIDAMVDRWKAQYPDISGSAAEHLAAGEEKLALDTTTAYAEAEVEFQKALVLDKSSDRAVAGWALALAFGKGDKVDGDTQKMAEQMLVAAESRGGDARVYVAHAHLLLVRSANLNDIQVLAERGKSSPSAKDQALAYLALGQAYLTKNAKTADDNLKEALKADPKLKRAYITEVRLLMNQGDYRTAVLTLEKRLESDPDQFEAADLLARIYLDVNEPTLAKKAYQKVAQAAAGALRPKVALAVFAYQHEGDLNGAAASLDGLLAQREKLDKGLLAEVLGHRAAVARLQGDFAAAQAHADDALHQSGTDTNAHLQKLFASLAQNNPTEARAQLSFAKLGDASLDAAIEGRVLLAEGKAGEAFTKLQKAIELDPRRTDVVLLAAAAAMKAKLEPKGWEMVLAKGYKADPMQSGPKPPMSAVYLSRNDIAGPVRGVFSKLGKDAEDPNPHLADGLIAWHLGDYAVADDAFAKVIVADPTNGKALSYRALVALKKRDVNNAMKQATKAVAAERTSGLAACTLGWAQLLSNKPDVARKTLQKAVELEPNLYLARARLAEADVRVRKVPDAKLAMTTVLLADPAYNEAKRVLYGINP